MIIEVQQQEKEKIMKSTVRHRASLFVSILLVASLSPVAGAQSARGIEQANPVAGLTPVSTEGLMNDDPTGPTEGCGDIDPSTPCYVNGGSDSSTCAAPTSLSTCYVHCDCVYKKNEEKCEKKLYCIRIAQAEQRACKTNCAVDWPY
jgi:hypothetical protein